MREQVLIKQDENKRRERFLEKFGIYSESVLL
jgi:hypothetical protein